MWGNFEASTEYNNDLISGAYMYIEVLPSFSVKGDMYMSSLKR